MGMKKLNKYLKNYFRDLLFKLCKKYGLEEEIFIEKYNNKFPRVRAIQQTIKELTTTNKSIIRFGDGEFDFLSFDR